jgi:WD40 repeat protein/tRNA A-37 threonylcarbamoyl transferase component Bud32
MDIDCPKCSKSVKLTSRTGEISCPHCGGSFRAEAFGDTANITMEGGRPRIRSRDAETHPIAREFAGYQIEEEIGRGGMGVVYKARDPELKRTVALKVLLSAEHASDEEIKRFFREAESAAKLQHPNIVPIHELKVHQGKHYYTMNYIEGDPLDALIDSGTLKVHQSLELMEKVADAVEHAHAAGIVHRDLKPGNIIIATDGEPKITDFGLAKVLGEGAAAAGGGLTQSGYAIGTPQYMAPEQAAGRSKQADARTDVYALGCVLYEMFAGSPPFVDENPMEVLRKHLQDDPVPPSQRGASVSSDAETICLKCLEKDPGRRYQSAGELAIDLRRCLDGEPITARRASMGYVLKRKLARHKVIVSVVAVASILLVAATATYIFSLRNALTEVQRQKRTAEDATEYAREQAEIAEEKRKQARAAELKSRTEERKAKDELFFSNITLAGTYAAEANIQRLDRVLEALPVDLRQWEWGRLRRDGHQQLKTLAKREHALWGMDLDPRGKRMVLSGEGAKIHVLSLPDGKQLLALDGARGGGGAGFSPDGKRVLFWGQKGLFRAWNAADGKQQYEFREIVPGTRNPHQIHAAVICPKSRFLATAGRDGIIRVRRARDGALLRELRGHKSQIFGLAFSPDGKLLASSSEDKTVRLWDPATGRGVMVLRGDWSYVAALKFSPDGRHLAFGTSDREILYWAVGTDSQPTKVLGHQRKVFGLDFSPDGKLLASCGDDRTIRVWDVTTWQELMTLKGHLHAVTNACFTRNGKQLISASWDQTVKLWDARKSRSTIILRGHTNNVWGIDLSPDGKTVATSGSDGVARLWKASTGEQMIVLAGHRYTIYGVRFSPDGKTVATCGADGTVRLWETRTGKALKKMEGHKSIVKDLVFSLDGSRLATVGWGVRIWEVSSGKQLKRLEDHRPGRNLQHVALSPDGKLLAVSGEDAVGFWELPGYKPLATLKTGPGQWVIGLAFSPDGKRLAGTIQGGDLRVWEMPPPAEAGKPFRELLRLRGHAETAHCVAFAPDGKRIASGSVDRTIRIWDAGNGRELLRLKDHTRRISGLDFGPKGRRLVSSSMDRTARIWLTDDWAGRQVPPESR